jgi:two-component system sensor histidine kinase KdpD
MQEYREGRAIRAIWAAGERLMVAVGPDDQAERLIRAGKRMATALHAEWIAVFVETPDLLRLSDEERNRRMALLRLAESLGAEAVTLGGSSVGEELANYAGTRNVTRILIGRPRRPLWQRLFRPSTYGELLAGTSGVDIHVVGGADEAAVLRGTFLARSRAYLQPGRSSEKARWPGYALGAAAVAMCTLLGMSSSPPASAAVLLSSPRCSGLAHSTSSSFPRSSRLRFPTCSICSRSRSCWSSRC